MSTLSSNFTLPKIDEIGNYLCAKIGKIKNIKMLKDSDGIGTGIYNISIEYPLNQTKEINFQELTGRKKFFNEISFITCYGDDVRCIYCEQFGHKKIDCAKYKLICPSCNKRGHDKCNLAKKIETEREDIDIEVEEETQTNEDGNINKKMQSSTVSGTPIQSKIDSSNTKEFPPLKTLETKSLPKRNNKLRPTTTSETIQEQPMTPKISKKREQPDIGSPENAEPSDIKFRLDTSEDELSKISDT